ncbi:hypothetical protein T484DRAFT_1755596 [Baffinella frigidus]|nr:hypothetical protein T484DRAFT_1755596 [Cryptophyta sp. CCMP2293]
MDTTTAEFLEARLNFREGVYAVHLNVTGEQKRLVADKMRLSSEDVPGAAVDLLNYCIALCEEHNYTETASKLQFVVKLQKRNIMARQARIAHEQLCTAKCMALAMAHHGRLGDVSPLQRIHPELMRVIIAAADLRVCSYTD